MMLKWVTSNCNQAKYLMKTDDDMFVNVPLLMQTLRSQTQGETLLGSLICNAKPISDPKNKWWVVIRYYIILCSILIPPRRCALICKSSGSATDLGEHDECEWGKAEVVYVWAWCKCGCMVVQGAIDCRGLFTARPCRCRLIKDDSCFGRYFYLHIIRIRGSIETIPWRQTNICRENSRSPFDTQFF